MVKIGRQKQGAMFLLAAQSPGAKDYLGLRQIIGIRRERQLTRPSPSTFAFFSQKLEKLSTTMHLVRNL
jgi:hypothetical protein|tara:strand:+ start:611 stop:817 length:207 start_codon:yes stop_codon:yes gene_type:complete